jgi:hypothetical protein
VWEVFGATSLRFLKALISRVSRADFVAPNWAAASPSAYWLQRFAVTLQRYNAREIEPHRVDGQLSPARHCHANLERAEELRKGELEGGGDSAANEAAERGSHGQGPHIILTLAKLPRGEALRPQRKAQAQGAAFFFFLLSPKSPC